MKMTNRVYDISKWIVLIFLPSLAVLIGGLGELYQWNSTSNIKTTINLITIFLGSLLQISTQKYHQRYSMAGGKANDTERP